MGFVTILELFERAANDRQRGATEIERDLLLKLLYALPLAGDESRKLREGTALLRAGQPCMANLLRLARCIERDCRDEKLHQVLEARLATLLQLGSLLGRNAASTLSSAGTLVTISRSAAVFAAINGVVREGWEGRVFVLDGSPSGRGEEQAQRLGKLGLEVRSLPDAAMLEAFDEASVGMIVLSGADAVGSRRIVNSQGTQLLMEVAAARGVRRVLIADSGKDLREKEIDGVLAASPFKKEAPGRSWPIFEACPIELFNERIREDGLVHLRED